MSSGLPSWLRDDGNSNDTTPMNNSYGQVGGSSSASSSSGPSLTNVKAHTFREVLNNRMLLVAWTIRITTMLLCILMFTTAIIGIGSIDGVESSGKLFVGVYMLFFSTVLFVFELIQIYPREGIDHAFRRNFGFIYGTMGRALFIIFIAFLSFGLGDPLTLTFTTGLLWACFGLANLGLYLKYPELFDPTEPETQQSSAALA